MTMTVAYFVGHQKDAGREAIIIIIFEGMGREGEGELGSIRHYYLYIEKNACVIGQLVLVLIKIPSEPR